MALRNLSAWSRPERLRTRFCLQLRVRLPDIVAEFHRRFPQLKLGLYAFHLSTTLTKLQESTIDMDFVWLPVGAKGVSAGRSGEGSAILRKIVVAAIVGIRCYVNCALMTDTWSLVLQCEC
jgi:hypothetical protein